MDKRILLVFAAGLVMGVLFAEVYYYVAAPLVLSDGATAVVVDRDYFDDVSSLIKSAKERVYVVMFSMQRYTNPEHWDSSSNKLLDALVAAKTRGVEVRVIIDEWPEGNDKAFGYLDERGVAVRAMHDEGTTHDKLLIIDGVVVVGSTNWSYYSLDKNHEANVAIRSEEIAARFKQYFDSLWASASGSL